jgi:hypothetical protein
MTDTRQEDVREALKQIAAFNITPSTGASVAMSMRRIAEEALSAQTDEPVAWRWRHVNSDSGEWNYQDQPIRNHSEYLVVEPLYASPLPQPDTVEIAKLREQLVSAQRAMDFCGWLDGYFGGINRRDELTASEANSIRAKLYGEVFPPAALTDEEQKSAPVIRGDFHDGERS